jgi:SAM-dependent methyltransferase
MLATRLSETPAPFDVCKLCGNASRLLFGLPVSKMTGHPIPDEPDDCWYYQCEACDFCYTRALDTDDHTEIYDEAYWNNQDPDWYGRVTQTFRLASLANELLKGHLPDLDILDFGCGIGGFVESARRDLALKVWGNDIIPPKVGKEWYLPDLGDRKFDIILACEVIEHLPDPRPIFDHIRSHLKSPGVFAFQTAYWDPESADRDWWYLGPGNGHISLYSARGFTHLFEDMKGADRRRWGGYAGVQAWLFT